MARQLYEFETQRTGITPKAFYKWVEKEFNKRCGQELYMWCDSFEAWTGESGIPATNITSKHEEWDEPKTEICKLLPYEWQEFMEKEYNFIMEFSFWDEKTGNGYCYITEFDR